MRIRQIDHRVHDALLNIDRKRGVTGWELMSSLAITGPSLYRSIDRLEDAGYIEFRWQGENWPNGGGFNDKDVPHQPGQARARLYRSTAQGRQVLAARIQSERGL